MSALSPQPEDASEYQIARPLVRVTLTGALAAARARDHLDIAAWKRGRSA